MCKINKNQIISILISCIVLCVAFMFIGCADYISNDGNEEGLSDASRIILGKGKPPRPTPTPTGGEPTATVEPTETPVIPCNKPFPQHATYTNGVIKPTNYSQSQLDQHVMDFYTVWKERYLYIAANTDPVQKYIYYNLEGLSGGRSDATVSEAHGYGMVILAYMAGFDPEAKADFDAMFRYFKAHPSRYNPKLMSWKQIKNSKTGEISDVTDSDSATDGDMDIAFALLLADKQWGSTGAINYKQEALSILQGMMEDVVSPMDDILWLGDWAVYDGDPKWLTGTRPSDWMFGHLRSFAAVDTAHSQRWNTVINNHLAISAYTNDNAALTTGMMPDFMYKEGDVFIPAEGSYLETRHDGDYYYNACRVPWRFPMDYILLGNTELIAQLTKFNNWIKGETGGLPENIEDGYYLDGRSFGRGNEMCYIAPMAVSAMINADNQAWLNALWDAIISVPADHYTASYFGNTIKMQVMITVSGNWWQP